MLRTETGARTLARIPPQDAATLTHLTNMDRTPVGSVGQITMAADGVPEWKAA
jgi:acetyl-CoA C-acetyltransferase